MVIRDKTRDQVVTVLGTLPNVRGNIQKSYISFVFHAATAFSS